MKMRLYLLFVAVLLAPVIAHGAGFPAIGHSPAAAGDAGAVVMGKPSPPTPHTGNLSEQRLILAHGNIVSQPKAAEPGPDLDLRYAAYASDGNDEADKGTGTQADEENGNGEDSSEDDEEGGDEEEDQGEEEEGGWDRLWDAPKLG